MIRLILKSDPSAVGQSALLKNSLRTLELKIFEFRRFPYTLGSMIFRICDFGRDFSKSYKSKRRPQRVSCVCNVEGFAEMTAKKSLFGRSQPFALKF